MSPPGIGNDTGDYNKVGQGDDTGDNKLGDQGSQLAKEIETRRWQTQPLPTLYN